MKLSSERQAAFCAALAEVRFVGKACRAVGISRRTAYQWREESPDFAYMWDRALGRPVIPGGRETCAVRCYSDALTMRLLKAHFPGKRPLRITARRSLSLDRMKLSSERQAAFCAALAETGFVGKACRAVDICRSTAYAWRDDDPDFAAAWDRAVRIGCTALEDEAQRRAFDGVDRPVFHGGQEVGSVKVYSDPLTMFLLKAHFPEKYRDRADTGARSGRPVEVVTGVPHPDDDDADDLASDLI